ncbi:hypothetical protein [Leadbettera azotonutricia]|uniref:Uncharacterized protein n=1 Tax=Leadbettera azotonutricia (strain ATCC BAA-888 / DSM 13862 / ZAS-9) TaxID=545695 RepID=F5Y715_LEAAZ|nr:hypothetical protein [Leadbettera azotonutricia]AEF82521.1 hypothetical protein TREAZ_1182 [Leadbettera azotonutricia ZAS-9]
MKNFLTEKMAVDAAGIGTDPKDAEKTTGPGAANSEKAIRGVFSQETAESITAQLTEAMNLFAKFGNTFTPHDRLRLIGAGIKNWGFIQTSFSHAGVNPQFVPTFLDMAEFKGAIDDFERKRALLTLIRQFAKIVSDSMLNDSDAAYHDGVDYYNYVREAARRRVPGAEAEHEVLRPYFKRGKRTIMDELNHRQTGLRNTAEG